MSIAMTKAWRPASDAELSTIPSTTGVYELRRRDGELLDIGYAGSREPFGLASAIAAAVAAAGGDDLEFRHEVHVQYRSRHIELVLVHRSRTDGLPPALEERYAHIRGRLSPS